MTKRHPALISRLALASVLVLGSMNFADARPGSKSSSGSRGSQTHSAPAPTATAPNAAQPMQRTVTQPGAPATTAQRPGAQQATPPAAAPSMGRSLMMGLAGGLLGAGLFGMLSGAGFLSGLGSFAGFLGLLLQVALIGGLVYLAIRFFRSRNGGAPMMPAMATAGAGPQPTQPQDFARMGSNLGGGGPATTPLTIGEGDYKAFEMGLKTIQLAYGNGDIGTLRMGATPEMASYFEQDLADNAAKGLVNRIGVPTLLQGDLSEAWTENGTDYATVAMRYSITDAMVEKASGRVVSGSLDVAEEVTEIWTFRRDHGHGWVLSAIQQTA